eukprot:TRINITY_DN6102_c0_g1_i1.p1 TRINITY_DN6102_c0_g1~~TRINITY_DN6102_c0_g1_i1.p1  ORF type:complete len:426 (+),score=59.77 TRINITY_DN6102_c0_g1_i1:60-1337(+)
MPCRFERDAYNWGLSREDGDEQGMQCRADSDDDVDHDGADPAWNEALQNKLLDFVKKDNEWVVLSFDKCLETPKRRAFLGSKIAKLVARVEDMGFTATVARDMVRWEVAKYCSRMTERYFDSLYETGCEEMGRYKLSYSTENVVKHCKSREDAGVYLSRSIWKKLINGQKCSFTVFKSEHCDNDRWCHVFYNSEIPSSRREGEAAAKNNIGKYVRSWAMELNYRLGADDIGDDMSQIAVVGGAKGTPLYCVSTLDAKSADGTPVELKSFKFTRAQKAERPWTPEMLMEKTSRNYSECVLLGPDSMADLVLGYINEETGKINLARVRSAAFPVVFNANPVSDKVKDLVLELKTKLDKLEKRVLYTVSYSKKGRFRVTETEDTEARARDWDNFLNYKAALGYGGDGITGEESACDCWEDIATASDES